MIKVSTTGMAVSLKTDLRFPESGQQGHGTPIIQTGEDQSQNLHLLCKTKQAGKAGSPLQAD